MPTVIYVDNDDEITSAAARIRATEAGPVALVVPNGSRLSTSRINFRLLAREAQARGRRLAIVAGDAATRALAASAGLPVYGSVGEFQESIGEEPSVPVVPAPATPSHPARRGPSDGSGPAGPAGATTAAAPAGPAVTATAAVPAPAAGPPVAALPPRVPPEAARTAIAFPRLGRPRLALERPAAAVTLAVLALAVVVLGVGAYLLLPTATITVTPHIEPIGPLTLSVRADPAVTASDTVAGVVPAQRLGFDLAASDTFQVNGKRIDETKATGRVTFRSKDPTTVNRIGAGSIVSTAAGVRFRTTATAVIPKATFVGLTVIPGQASVGVEAVVAGTASNVDANTIIVIPATEDPILTDVRNRAPTTGGTHQEFPRIDKADVDAAVAQLTKQLGQDFETILAEPGRVPAGLTAFAETRSLSDPLPTVDPTTLVGQEVATFQLELASTGTVVAVDQSLVTALVAARVQATVSTDHRLVDGSLQVDLGQPSIDGQSVLFSVTARAVQVRVLDAPSLVAMIKGKPIPQARAALEPFGDVRVTVWPDWVSSIPTIDGRIDLRIGAAQPSAGSSPQPSSAPVASPSASAP